MATASDTFRAAMSQLVDASEGQDAAQAAFQVNEDARPPRQVDAAKAEDVPAAPEEPQAVEEPVAAPVDAQAEGEPEAEPVEAQAPEEGAPEEEPGTLVEMEDGSRVPLAELVRGQMREADYTRKTQELASQKREVEATKQAAVAQSTEAMQHLAGMSQQLELAMNRYQPNAQQMAQLRQRDPVEWAARNEETRQQQELIQAANNEAERLRQAQQAIVVPQQRQALAQKVPAFEKDFETEYQQLGEYATSPDGGGLQREEWAQLVDHRHVTLVWKAQQYDKAARSAPRIPNKLPRNTPKVLRPGVQTDARDTKSEGYAAALARQKEQGGDVRSTADAFAAREQLRRGR